MGLVKNLHNTSHKKCSCSGTDGAWINHWRLHSGSSAYLCRKEGCHNIAEDGAHVKKVNTNDHSHYIVALCRSCNKTEDVFEVYYKYLVPAQCL